MKSTAVKLLSAFLAIMMLASALSSCISFESADDGKIKIVCTVFPVYDWTRNIVGDSENTEIILLGGSGVDMHNYQPSVSDIVKITSCDIFIYIGGESEEWVEDALGQSVNSEMTVMNLISILGDKALEEEHKEGMEEENHGDEEKERENDEHIWMSLSNAGYIVSKISAAVSDKDPENAELYGSNAEKYNSDLKALKDEYTGKIADAAGKTIVVADRFPFLYLVKEFGIDYYAAFSGCSAETEASFKTISTLSDKIKEYGLKYVIVTDGSDKRIAETVVSTAGASCEIVSMDSMQAVTLNRINAGYNYLDAMRSALATLLTVLE